MSYERLAYDDHDTTVKMAGDCVACASEMSLPEQVPVLGAAPSIEYADYPREVLKPEISISDATAHLASRIHLHLD
jgi:hypothetical protein